MTFDADLPHHFENPGEGEARFYAVVAAEEELRRREEELVPKTLFDKIWEAHEVADALLRGPPPRARGDLRAGVRGPAAGRQAGAPSRPDPATADHNVPTDGSTAAEQIRDQLSRVQVETLEQLRGVRGAGVPSAPGARASST